jgi:hypothetical protein
MANLVALLRPWKRKKALLDQLKAEEEFCSWMQANLCALLNPKKIH